ncbi:MAG: sigma-54-dependent Fis family transcriptional regulator [Desulfobacteraceae bacterium]|nr:sigma-54-dependent Fis family transcriptional regulator [Desulfobacteraceae bacterium]
MARILIIDDDAKIGLFLTKLLKRMEHEVSMAQSLSKGLGLAESGVFDLVLLDLEFPEGNGIDILQDLMKVTSRPEVIIITGTGGGTGAELAFKYGAWDYVQKPFLLDEVNLSITRALQYRREKQVDVSPVPLLRKGIIGESDLLQWCLQEVAKASATDGSVLITGETGTGKELFSRAIHNNSKRASRPFVAVDCGALPDTLVESTLFGHKKGAFTGADRHQDGLIVQADGGTLFLDEVGDLPLNVQIALLRTIQEKKVRPLGGGREKSVDFRLVAATNRDLDALVTDQLFREDLLYRIRAMSIHLPPLRDRKEDIEEIAVKKLHELSNRYFILPKGISKAYLDALTAHSWPGNVRELINVLDSSLGSAGQDPTLFPKHLPPEYRMAVLKLKSHEPSVQKAFPGCSPEGDDVFPTLNAHRERVESEYLTLLLKRAEGDRKKAESLSGISQSRLYGLLKKHGLPGFSKN